MTSLLHLCGRAFSKLIISSHLTWELRWLVKSGEQIHIESSFWPKSREQPQEITKVKDFLDDNKNWIWTFWSLCMILRKQMILLGIILLSMVWKANSCGTIMVKLYSTKQGYLLQMPMIVQRLVANRRLWNIAWKLKMPKKILMFVWKIMHKAFPLGVFLLRHRINRFCQMRCSVTKSYEHIFWKCPVAKASWFASNLSIRTDYIHSLCVQDWIVKIAGESRWFRKDGFMTIPPCT